MNNIDIGQKYSVDRFVKSVQNNLQASLFFCLHKKTHKAAPCLQHIHHKQLEYPMSYLSPISRGPLFLIPSAFQAVLHSCVRYVLLGALQDSAATSRHKKT
eukprot:gnl/MRDRNA2_/MRDRNA2_213467_c0_seq1.p1 gnl/MRDRNA2_/MRDRNA2_213467_c0~~gnl/MRDRNA2_/MRDRNA2_213467_c0_seq1.p1  ORF type:complete len:101 (-),score=0.45 gnl/MRDRNA2_/MRDRNA2_213467_c0_seq1:339-641(-)